MLPFAANGLPAPVVLLVDDEESVRSALRAILETMGFEVLEACGGPESIERVVQGGLRPDLVISDFMMPAMNGVETLTALGRLCPGLRTILCSGTPEGDCLQGSALENCLYLGKPFRLAELELTMARAFAQAPQAGPGRDPVTDCS